MIDGHKPGFYDRSYIWRRTIEEATGFLAPLV